LPATLGCNSHEPRALHNDVALAKINNRLRRHVEQLREPRRGRLTAVERNILRQILFRLQSKETPQPEIAKLLPRTDLEEELDRVFGTLKSRTSDQ
jgi:hypothetical protein